jgi:hypothetical protein
VKTREIEAGATQTYPKVSIFTIMPKELYRTCICRFLWKYDNSITVKEITCVLRIGTERVIYPPQEQLGSCPYLAGGG